MYKLETHFHTAETSPCATVRAWDGVDIYKAFGGYNGIVVTDHFSEFIFGPRGLRAWEAVVSQFLLGYRRARQRGTLVDVDVFLGMELRFPGSNNDFLVYGITEGFLLENPWLYELDLETFFPIAQKYRLAVVQAHPFREGCTPASPSLIHGIEVLNGNTRHDSHNRQAAVWTRQYQLPETCGTDFHEPGDCAGIGMAFSEPIKTERQLVKSLLKRTNVEWLL